jgi:hypothetical protein
LTLALSGIEAGEEASRLDLEMSVLICFDYRPAVIAPLGPTNTRRLLTGEGGNVHGSVSYVKATEEVSVTLSVLQSYRNRNV